MPVRPLIASRFVAFLDWFIPPNLQENEELSRRIRTFVVSHVAGPPAGFVVAGYLSWVNPNPYVFVLLAGVSLFVLFPFLLRWTGRHEEVALASLLHFIALIFYVALLSGGIESYAVPWALAVPIVCVFFVHGWYRAVGFAALGAGLVTLLVLHGLDVELPNRMMPVTPTSRLVLLLAAAGYITVMALVYINLYEDSLVRLRWARDAAETASRSKTDFLARMSHELRTPLNAVIGFSQVMNHQMLGPIGNERYLEYCRDIEKSGRHLLEIINEILDIARIEAGRLELELAACDPVRVVDEAGRIVAPLAAEGGVRLRQEVVAGLSGLMADERLLRQVLINLLTNAVKFSPRDSEIVVRAWQQPDGTGADELWMTVRDQGPGIAAKDLKRALQPFEQLDSAFTRKHGGLGLGLPLSKRIVERHGGTLTLDSQPGEGTCVTVRLPLRPDLGSEGPQPSGGGQGAANDTTQSKSVAVVEDESGGLRALARLIGGSGPTAASPLPPA